MCEGVSGQIHDAPGVAPSRLADLLTATTTATRCSSTSFGSPAVPDVGITIATPGATGAPPERSVSPSVCLTRCGRARSTIARRSRSLSR
jgi:hypothetical protein